MLPMVHPLEGGVFVPREFVELHSNGPEGTVTLSPILQRLSGNGDIEEKAQVLVFDGVCE